MKTTGNYKLFSIRQKYVDAILITMMPISFLLYTSAPSIIILFFAFFGMWMIFQKPKLLDDNRTVLISSVSVAMYMLINILVIGFSTGVWNGLNDVFPLYFVLTIPIIIGLSLVRNSMKYLILGCRIAAIIFVILSTYTLIENSSQRIGFGTNPIITAYLLMIYACISRFRINNTEKIWVGGIYFYAGIVNAIATGTRIIIVFYIVVIILEFLFLIYRLFKKEDNARRNLFLAFFLPSIFIILCLNYAEVLRIQSTLDVLTSGNILLDEAVKLRVYMLEFGWSTFTQNILFGIGASNIHSELSVYLQELHNIKFAARQLHNMYIHELAAHGIIGASLILFYHSVVYRAIARHFKELPETHSVYLLFLGILIFGLTGSYITDDRMVLFTIFVFATLIKSAKRSEPNI
ncbi:O-antigen ligase family protein [Lentilitoribacter sp. Alg239-R112]|uniref:O-antigen ligase family protein n=1 Tax=Lentilitoribacter sp. Alg239-R112 TaxID=2305987 RepID=UPI0013A6F0B4|nr:O-antigen ligase family protein [Lentilitoribacter sp. Alg239-R112]